MKRITTALLLAACASAWAQDTTPPEDDPVAKFHADVAGIRAEVDAQDKANAELAKKPNAKIGMSAQQVRTATNWGEPNSVNRTRTGRHVHEQWVYGDSQYLYFDDGRLTAIQNSH